VLVFTHASYSASFGLIFVDIRELISLDDVMEELGMGPNGGLIYCMEYPIVSIACCFVGDCCLRIYLVLNWTRVALHDPQFVFLFHFATYNQVGIATLGCCSGCALIAHHCFCSATSTLRLTDLVHISFERPYFLGKWQLELERPLDHTSLRLGGKWDGCTCTSLCSQITLPSVQFQEQ
jgi:hypothetical protein